MKNRKTLLLTACLLVFSSCTPGGSAKKLVMGAISADDQGIHWDAVEGASKYSVVVNSEEPVEVTNTSYDFATEAGDYEVMVTAIAGDSSHSNSDPTSFSYKTKLTTLDYIESDGASITWGSYNGKGIEVKKQSDGQFVPVQGNSYVVTESDLYVVRAASGYKEGIYFAENPTKSAAEKGIVVSVGATENFVIEDGSEEDNSELAETYSVSKYATSSWVDSSAAIILDRSNEGFSEGNCIQLQYWHHSTWFKYTKAISLDKRYDTFSFKVKGQVATYTSLTFEIIDHIVVAGQDLIGVYISYQINPVVDQWTYYTVSLDDPNWVVSYGGGKYQFSQVQSLLASGGYIVQSLADMMPFFKQFSFRANATADQIGTKAYLYYDDVMISNSHSASSSETPIKLEKNYAVDSAAFSGKATFNNDNTAILNIKMKNGGNEVQLPVEYSVSNSKLRMVCRATGYDFDATFLPGHNGDSFTLDNASGSGASALTNFKADKYFVFDDFESYTETGVGIDNNHRTATPTGLRAAYYADWYNETDPSYAVSPIGDPNWKLMGSDNYIELDKTNGRSSSKAMKIRYSSAGAMRYCNSGIITGDAEPFTGKTFSFWAKGTSGSDITVKVRVFSVNKLTINNHVSDEVSVMKPIVIEKNSDWTEYTVELKEGTTYYGFSFTTQAVKDTAAQFPLIDDIYVYGSLSPWGN